MYDLIIIGAGAGGLTCAYTANGLGKKVLLVDKGLPGGTCTWSGCMPSKALINIGKDVHAAKKYSSVEIDTAKVMKDVRDAIEEVYSHESPEILAKDGITFKKGEQIKIIDPKIVLVDEVEYHGKNIVISTGTSPFIPPLEGLDKIDYLTNQNLFQLEKLPKSMIILGGGAIGVEMAQCLNRLGTTVHIMERSSRIFIRESEELVNILSETLIKEGVNIHVNTNAVSVTQDDEIISLNVETGGEPRTIEAEALLVSIGRVPNVENLGLDELGLKYNKKGIQVDDYLRTNIHNIYGVGDVAGPYQFSHTANYQGILAVKNMFLPLKKKVDYSNISWCTFTSPELASRGLPDPEGKETKIYSYGRSDSDRTMTKKGDIFEMRVETNHKKEILEVKILAERAGEMISSLQIAAANHLTLDKLSPVIFPHPSYSEILGKLGKKAYVDKLLENPFINIFAK
ncbi:MULTISPECIES: dihydrolipoyl dehydrogenase family protein [Psychrilyobacter]|uniref:FAD-binding protein n=1 Tax=Psychrilyobacter piezotolerans TaxID=2293438 RepID=A0ABX9KJR3_9FUSO|nr:MULTISPECIES: FAD-dependent oxidoreductase [Psychrilyobacter]MCS5422773.1 FAD-dependent oxidoreductase [Psychrilyobacter sp. S5]NDI76933.1 FAD-dependent oxidoreductase [Psychrilyobacter piezotolerans]RDE64557.1 FAD-binding protein [Psychrilyobacter sp. S5]REI42369.1 FAD-binding protein [Psychrilyobacter piezotolerans]